MVHIMCRKKSSNSIKELEETINWLSVCPNEIDFSILKLVLKWTNFWFDFLIVSSRSKNKQWTGDEN